MADDRPETYTTHPPAKISTEELMLAVLREQAQRLTAAAEERGRAEGRQWAIDTLRDWRSHRVYEETDYMLAEAFADDLEAMAAGGTDDRH